MLVSGETLGPDMPIYERMTLWAVWATDRREVPIRPDELAGDFKINESFLKRIEDIRQRCFPPAIEAVEKAVADLRLSHDKMLLFHMVDEYFLKWKTIPTIAISEDLSEHHVIEYLQRALRQIAHTLPDFERQVSAERRG